MGNRATRPTTPWTPDSLTVMPILRAMTRVRPRGAGARSQEAKERACWDVRWRVDGLSYFARFYRAAEAAVFAEELRTGKVKGWTFDPVTKRFAPAADQPAATSTLTVFAWTAEYWAFKWQALEPKSRHELARYLNRARSFFVDREPTEHEAPAVADYLAHAGLSVRTEPLTADQEAGQRWLEQHSVPLAEVDRSSVAAMVAHYGHTVRDPLRQTAPSTERRMVADLKQCWERAVREERLATNPWNAVDLRRRTASGGSSSTSLVPADAELVLSPQQIEVLADRCVTEGTWGEMARCFVLVMGLCGLRPNEAVGLVVGDLELPDAGPAWLTVRRTRRSVPERHLDPEEDPDWGPLKGRQLTATRRVPVPGVLAAILRNHLAEFCDEAKPTDLVFHRMGKPFDLSVFSTDVWHPARRSLFPPVADLDERSPLQPRLSRLRRHDLRHSACSMWLRARIDVTVCQRWSGHKRLSVFLDVYQGLIPGREEEGVRLLEEHLGAGP